MKIVTKKSSLCVWKKVRMSTLKTTMGNLCECRTYLGIQVKRLHPTFTLRTGENFSLFRFLLVTKSLSSSENTWTKIYVIADMLEDYCLNIHFVVDMFLHLAPTTPHKLAQGEDDGSARSKKMGRADQCQDI